MKRITTLIFLLSLAGMLHAQSAVNPWEEINQSAKRHLVNLIHINTSQPEPQEIQAARYIYKELNKYHIDWDILRPSKKHANLLARLQGSDSTQKPLLLISHLDTAPVGEGWSVPPFSATEKEGNIYGLGATDAKNYTAIYLALLTWLKQNNYTPVRDIIFLATSGEEVGSATGLQWLGATHWDKINPGYALNEGGGIIENDSTNIVFAEASTKMYMDIKVTAYGTAGHSSLPANDNAVYSLSQALAKIEEYQPPTRLIPPVRNFFKAIRPLQDEDGQTTIDFLLSGTLQKQQVAAEIMSQDPFFRTQLKDTLNPTTLSSGHDTGSTSEEASAVINARLLPGSDPDELLKQLRALFTPQDNISLEILERPQLPFPTPMDGTDPLFASIERTAQKLLPGSITVPGLSPASGDNEFLRKLGVITYGLGPNMDPLEKNSAHNADEFINEQSFYNQLKFVAGVLFDFAYEEDLLPLQEPNASPELTTAEEQPAK